MNDCSQEFSFHYLSKLEQILKVSYTSDGDPVVLIDSINKTIIHSLKTEMTSLLESSLAQEAIEYEKRSSRNKIISVGFGLSGNFSDFVKLGLLCGDRVVLWDIILSKTLSSGIITPRTSDLIAEFSSNLLSLKPLVEAGAVVILPHPTMWSDLARNLHADIGNKDLSTSDVGFLTALTAILEGMQLHPYTLAFAPTPSHDLLDNDEAKNYFSETNQNFQRSVSKLFQFEEMKYLRSVDATDFYNCLQDRGDFQRALRNQLALPLTGLSEQQKARELEANVAKIVSLLEHRNKKVLSYASGVGEASIGAISGTIAAFSVETAATQAAALGIYSLVQFWSAGHNILKSPPKNILVQTFTKIREFSNTNGDVISNRNSFSAPYVNQETKDAYAKFISFYWTEQRHHYLQTLPKELARELIKLISPSDLQIIVNWRRHQEDYIGEYLEYLWGLDEDAFWDHLSVTFEGEDGLLMYDNIHHIEMMTSRNMPSHVWDSMLNSILNVHWNEIENGYANYPLDYFPEIIRFQTTNSTDHLEKRDHLLRFLSALRYTDLSKLMWFIDEIYDEGIPEWLEPTLKNLLRQENVV